jgi:hypothetical protein
VGPAGALFTRYPDGRLTAAKGTTMNETNSAAMRLPVQGVVDRTQAHGTLADGSGVQASWNFADLFKGATDFLPPVVTDFAPPLTSVLSQI